MYTPAFDYHRPASVEEALALLGQHADAKILAGGHSLVPAMKLRAATPSAVIDIGRIPGLSGVTASDGRLRIGALTTHHQVASDPAVVKDCPLLSETAAHIGDQQVRNRGTIGGSLAHADPAADYPTAILALDAEITITGAGGERVVAARDFFVDLFTVAIGHDELVTAVRVPVYGAGTGGSYHKHRHPASSYAVAGAAALVTVAGGVVRSAALAIGGVQVKAVRASAAEQALVGQAPTPDAIAAAAAKVAEAIDHPISDLYASGDYRTHLATVLARRALADAVAKA